MIAICDYCGKEYRKHGKPNTKRGNYCCKEHRHKALYKEYTCCICGKKFERKISDMKKSKNACCSKECTFKFHSKTLKRINPIVNKVRMTPEIREKIRNRRLNKGDGKSYEKTYGRHSHRLIAEAMLGRKLLPGEIVHHKDMNKRNNNPDNLMVMTQSEHARLHAKLRIENGQKLFVRLSK